MGLASLSLVPGWYQQRAGPSHSLALVELFPAFLGPLLVERSRALCLRGLPLELGGLGRVFLGLSALGLCPLRLLLCRSRARLGLLTVSAHLAAETGAMLLSLPAPGLNARPKQQEDRRQDHHDSGNNQDHDGGGHVSRYYPLSAELTKLTSAEPPGTPPEALPGVLALSLPRGPNRGTLGFRPMWGDSQ
jgi:hypothetical protein